MQQQQYFITTTSTTAIVCGHLEQQWPTIADADDQFELHLGLCCATGVATTSLTTAATTDTNGEDARATILFWAAAIDGKVSHRSHLILNVDLVDLEFGLNEFLDQQQHQFLQRGRLNSLVESVIGDAISATGTRSVAAFISSGQVTVSGDHEVGEDAPNTQAHAADGRGAHHAADQRAMSSIILDADVHSHHGHRHAAYDALDAQLLVDDILVDEQTSAGPSPRHIGDVIVVFFCCNLDSIASNRNLLGNFGDAHHQTSTTVPECAIQTFTGW